MSAVYINVILYQRQFKYVFFFSVLSTCFYFNCTLRLSLNTTVLVFYSEHVKWQYYTSIVWVSDDIIRFILYKHKNQTHYWYIALFSSNTW
jgi:hypothetical protein